MKLAPFNILVGDDPLAISREIKEAANEYSLVYYSELFSVDEVRELISKAYLLHQSTAFVLENAQNMTSQAQNALLKLAEEPPEKCFIILITNDLKKLLPTIQSRANIVSGLFVEKEIVFDSGVKELALKLRDNLDRVNKVNLLNVLSHLEKEQYDLFFPCLFNCWEQSPDLFAELRQISFYRNSVKPGTNLQRHLTDLFFVLWDIRNGGGHEV